MKWIRILAVACTASLGCTMLSPPSGEEKIVRSEDVRPSFRPPVVAGQLNPANAQEKAKALNEELDRELQAAIEARDSGK